MLAVTLVLSVLLDRTVLGKNILFKGSLLIIVVAVSTVARRALMREPER